MVGGKGGCTFATVKCLVLVVIWQFFLCGFDFSCSWRYWIQILKIRVWSVRNDATSDNWVLPIIKCPPVVAAFRGMHVSPAKHSYAWLPRKCDYQTDRRTDRPGTKRSLCSAMLHRRHNKLKFKLDNGSMFCETTRKDSSVSYILSLQDNPSGCP